MAVDIPQMQMQLLIALGLLGVYAGWRGGMAKMAGFYDMPNATKHLGWGIVVGSASVYFIDGLFVQEVAYFRAVGVANLSLMFFLGLLQSLVIHFLLTRKGVRLLRAPPTSGWTLGLGMGAIISSYLMIRMASPGWPGFASGFTPLMIFVGLWITFTLPVGEAALGAWQGSAITTKKPLTVMWQAGIFRGLLLIVTLIGVTAQPVFLLSLPLAAYWGFTIAEEKWLPAALLPAIKQEYDRTLRMADRRRRERRERARGDVMRRNQLEEE